jgi:hypothetical protein
MPNFGPQPDFTGLDLQKSRDSVAKGPKFRQQNSKGALQKFVRPEKLAAEIPLNMLKKGRKGAELF